MTEMWTDGMLMMLQRVQTIELSPEAVTGDLNKHNAWSIDQLVSVWVYF